MRYGVALPVKTTACCVCGAQRDVKSHYRADVCERCWLQFDGWRLGDRRGLPLPLRALADRDISDADVFNIWLAHKLTITAERLRRYGVAGRCEAIVDDRQCGRPASAAFRGRRVCASHGEGALSVVFVGEKADDPFGRLAEAVGLLARQHLHFARLLTDTIAPSTSPARTPTGRDSGASPAVPAGDVDGGGL